MLMQIWHTSDLRGLPGPRHLGEFGFRSCVLLQCGKVHDAYPTASFYFLLSACSHYAIPGTMQSEACSRVQRLQTTELAGSCFVVAMQLKVGTLTAVFGLIGIDIRPGW